MSHARDRSANNRPHAYHLFFFWALQFMQEVPRLTRWRTGRAGGSGAARAGAGDDIREDAADDEGEEEAVGEAEAASIVAASRSRRLGAVGMWGVGCGCAWQGNGYPEGGLTPSNLARLSAQPKRAELSLGISVLSARGRQR